MADHDTSSKAPRGRAVGAGGPNPAPSATPPTDPLDTLIGWWLDLAAENEEHARRLVPTVATSAAVRRARGRLYARAETYRRCAADLEQTRAGRTLVTSCCRAPLLNGTGSCACCWGEVRPPHSLVLADEPAFRVEAD